MENMAVFVGSATQLSNDYYRLFAFYFYFVVSFKLETLYIQVCKLFIDLQVAVKTIPIAVWLIVGYVMFAKWRKKLH